jgi:hypothetical protein
MTKKEKLDKQEESVYLKCTCRCSMFVVDKTKWGDGEIWYNITVQDSRYDHKNTTFLGRVKSAFKILFGKPIYYSDVFLDDPNKYRQFVAQLQDLCEKESKDDEQ